MSRAGARAAPCCALPACLQLFASPGALSRCADTALLPRRDHIRCCRCVVRSGVRSWQDVLWVHRIVPTRPLPCAQPPRPAWPHAPHQLLLTSARTCLAGTRAHAMRTYASPHTAPPLPAAHCSSLVRAVSLVPFSTAPSSPTPEPPPTTSTSAGAAPAAAPATAPTPTTAPAPSQALAPAHAAAEAAAAATATAAAVAAAGEPGVVNRVLGAYCRQQAELAARLQAPPPSPALTTPSPSLSPPPAPATGGAAAAPAAAPSSPLRVQHQRRSRTRSPSPTCVPLAASTAPSTPLASSASPQAPTRSVGPDAAQAPSAGEPVRAGRRTPARVASDAACARILRSSAAMEAQLQLHARAWRGAQAGRGPQEGRGRGRRSAGGGAGGAGGSGDRARSPSPLSILSQGAAAQSGAAAQGAAGWGGQHVSSSTASSTASGKAQGAASQRQQQQPAEPAPLDLEALLRVEGTSVLAPEVQGLYGSWYSPQQQTLLTLFTRCGGCGGCAPSALGWGMNGRGGAAWQAVVPAPGLQCVRCLRSATAAQVPLAVLRLAHCAWLPVLGPLCAVAHVRSHAQALGGALQPSVQAAAEHRARRQCIRSTRAAACLRPHPRLCCCSHGSPRHSPRHCLCRCSPCCSTRGRRRLCPRRGCCPRGPWRRAAQSKRRPPGGRPPAQWRTQQRAQPPTPPGPSPTPACCTPGAMAGAAAAVRRAAAAVPAAARGRHARALAARVAAAGVHMGRASAPRA